MSKHTPGPWRIELKNGKPRVIVALKEKVVCEHTYWFGKVDEANFRILAASLDLLEALKSVMEEVQEDSPQANEYTHKAMAEARAAIAKAEGA